MCKHHWLVDSRNQGICKLCGKEKDFQAALSNSMRTNDKVIPFERRIIERFSVANDYYLQGHLTTPVKIG